MSKENVEAFKRGVDAWSRRDLDAGLKELDAQVEWHGEFQVRFWGERTVYRGHRGVTQLFRDLDEVFEGVRADVADIRDIGDRVIAVGRLRTRGRGSGAETESPFGWVVDFKDGKAIRIQTYLDPKHALEAAGLSE